MAHRAGACDRTAGLPVCERLGHSRFHPLRCGTLGKALAAVSYRHEHVRREGEGQSSGLPVKKRSLRWRCT
jgi:hypothetical protein